MSRLEIGRNRRTNGTAFHKKGKPGGPQKRPIPRYRNPDLSGMTIGTWKVLYEEKGEGGSYCMCLCTRCGVRRIIPTFKLRKGYALRCTECRIRQEFAKT